MDGIFEFKTDMKTSCLISLAVSPSIPMMAASTPHIIFSVGIVFDVMAMLNFSSSANEWESQVVGLDSNH